MEEEVLPSLPTSRRKFALLPSSPFFRTGIDRLFFVSYSMKRLQIPYLGSVVNAGVLISLLSTANTYGSSSLPSLGRVELLFADLVSLDRIVYTVSRSLHGLALAGQAPKIFRTLNRESLKETAASRTATRRDLSFSRN